MEDERTGVREATTELLARFRAGDRIAADALFERIYPVLHRLARGRLARLRPGQTLNTTALVHEAYLKLVAPAGAEWHDRAHFLAVSSTAMRQILVDRARRVSARKRGGPALQVTAEVEDVAAPERATEVLALDQALDRLEAIEPRLARTVQLRFFGGLSVEETAEVMGSSPRTVKRDWRKARAWLYRELRSEPGC